MRSKFKWIFTLIVAFTVQFSFAQTVSGVVTDASGPVFGANVVVKGAAGRSVQTDVDGKYTIKANDGETLVFSYVDLKTEERKVNGSKLNVKLASGAREIEEVVIGAMNIKRSKDAVVSAQKQVGGKELNQASNPNAIQALTGKVSGMQVSTTGNGVNSSTRIVLRGNRTITGDNRALVVIDNAISSSDVLSQLPPEVIENVNVIKGAQGAALYGAQGVNGVIIVTTKKGTKNNKMTFGFNSSVDFESVSFVPKTQTKYGQGWATDAFDLGSGDIDGYVPFENGSWGPAYGDPSVSGLLPVGLPQADGSFFMSEYKPIKNNIKQFFKTGTIFQNGFNFNVGGEDGYVFMSVNRQTTDYVVQDDALVKNSFLFKAGKKFGKFNIEGNVNYITQKTTQTDSGLFDDLVQTASNVPVSRFKDSGNLGHWTVYAQNPYWTTKAVRFDDATNVVNGILALNYTINKNISVQNTANVQVGSSDGQSHNDGFNQPNYLYDFSPYNYHGDQIISYENLGGQQVTSSYFANHSTTRNVYNDLVFNFNYDLTNDLNLKFNIGNNIQDRMFRVTTQGGTNIDVPGFYHITNVLSPNNPSTLDNRMVRSRAVAGFANVDLDYKHYLFLNATGRLEQTSVVKDAFFYPSIGVSFIPTKAIDALKDNKVLNYAKLNASYTSVGNTSAVGVYSTNELAAIPTGFPFGDLAALQYNQSPTNPNIKPEFVNTLEVGAQFGFFKDRITLEGSYYTAKTKDLITRVTASSASGNSGLLDNVGDLENKGFEIDLGFTPIKTSNFRWDVKTNYATSKTKIIKLSGDATSVNLQSNSQIGVFAEVGEEFPLIKGTAFVRDANGNVVVGSTGLPQTTSTFQKLGKGVPDYVVGMSNSFEYKGFRLTAVADLRMGASAYSFAKNLLMFTGGDLETADFDRTQGYVFPGVTSTGAVNTTPAFGTPSAVGVLNYFTTTHRAVGESSVIDAAALKVRELSLSYALPKKMIERAGLESFRIGINARNPFVFLADGKLLKAKNGVANNGYADPEASNTAQAIGPANNPFRAGTGNALGIINIGQYPSTRTFGFTLNLTF